LEGDLQELPDAELRRRMYAAAPAVVQAGRAAGLADVLALAREGARRSLGIRPFDTQLMGAAVLLEGWLAEMQTGEGRTLTAGLAATIAGAAGLPIHVVTVNDYLARRDAELMAPLFLFFEMTAGVVWASLAEDAKRTAYQRPIIYCTNQSRRLR
jgi:preprotein translocase subunit SecA